MIPLAAQPMDDDRYLVRELRDSDYEALAAVENAIKPEQPESAESLRHFVESFRTFSDLPHLVVQDLQSGRILGSGVLFHPLDQKDPARPWIHVGVHPSHRHQGIGSRLYDALAAEARRRGATGLRCSVEGDSSDGRAFVAKREFIERRRSWCSSLDVASADTSDLKSLTRTLSSTGIEFTTLSREGVDDLNVLHRLHDLDSATAVDEPHVGAFTAVPFEEYRRLFLEGPLVLPEAWILAKEGDRYVGISSAAREPARPNVLMQYYTGTRREHRRKKIALTLKLLLIEYAKQHGYVRIETNNDSLNTAMWTLNQRLGFRKLWERIHLECEFSEAAGGQGPARA